MSNKEFKIKFEQEVKAKKGTDEKTFLIRTKGGNEEKVTFKDGVKKDDDSEADVNLEYREKDAADKNKWETLTAKVKYDGGMFLEGVKLEKKKFGDYEMNEELKPSVGFFSSMRWPTYALIFVVIIAIGALIWWWVASSKSEDKEEESL